MNKNVKKVVFSGVLAALALIFSYIEFLIPIPLPIPGIKLGIANSAIVVVLFLLGPVYAFFVGMIRIILSAALFGNMFSFFFSLAGFLLSFMVQSVLKRTGKFSIVGISIAGAVFHNVGQIATAVIIMSSSGIAMYMPVLTITGIITGGLIGYLCQLIVKRIIKYDFISKGNS